mmetsp:Transcript_3065/g.6607  ORF Transcript_3065/g.6607 Transcript_3065/m.6607 type:complete len:157 (+) Transcript_3065:299-769(+)
MCCGMNYEFSSSTLATEYVISSACSASLNLLFWSTPFLTTESVKGASLALEGVDDVHGSDGLAASVLRVGDGITNDVLEEDLEDTTGFFVDQSGDTLDTTSTCETTDGRLGDTLDIVAKDLSVTLGASLSESLSSFSSSRHGCGFVFLFSLTLVCP